jgi:hypothetical protein
MTGGGESDDHLRSENQANQRGEEGSGKGSPTGAGDANPDADELPCCELVNSAEHIARTLKPSYRLHLQEAFRLETDPSKLALYKELIENEAAREVGIFDRQFSANSEAVNKQTTIASLSLVLSSAFEFLKWAAPAVLVLYCAYKMGSAYRYGLKDAAATYEKILYILITGATLGWAVSRNSGSRGEEGG